MNDTTLRATRVSTKSYQREVKNNTVMNTNLGIMNIRSNGTAITNLKYANSMKKTRTASAMPKGIIAITITTKSLNKKDKPIIETKNKKCDGHV